MAEADRSSDIYETLRMNISACPPVFTLQEVHEQLRSDSHIDWAAIRLNEQQWMDVTDKNWKRKVIKMVAPKERFRNRVTFQPRDRVPLEAKDAIKQALVVRTPHNEIHNLVRAGMVGQVLDASLIEKWIEDVTQDINSDEGQPDYMSNQ